MVVRFYLLFILAVGAVASMLTNGSEGAAPSQRDPNVIAVTPPEPHGQDWHRLSGDAVALRRQSDGHFYADVQINSTTIRMLVDTGASGVALSREDARRAGIGVSIAMPSVVGRGASGDVRGEYVTIDRISLGGESAESVPAVVLEGGEKSLLGQSFLSRFASVEIKGDMMVLR